MVLLYKFIADNKLVNAFLFPPLDSIVTNLGKNKVTMFKNMLSSFQLMIPAVVISVVIALFVGTVMGMNKRVREVLHPVIYAVSVIPSILLAPFALLLAPNFRTASLFLIIYGTIWSTLFATITGIQTIDKRYLDTAATLELRGFRKLVKIILPAASPSILAGFVNSLRGSFVVLVYAEMYGAKYGMGYYVKKYSEYGLYSETWSGFIFMVVVLIIVMQLFEKIKERLLKWTIN
jgi:NitT/TauT family transport system permease protein